MKNNFIKLLFLLIISIFSATLLTRTTCFASNLHQNPELKKVQKLINKHQTAEALRELKQIPNSNIEVTKWLIDNAGTIEPVYLYLIADRVFETNKEDAITWALTARIRSRYDGYRCEDTSARNALMFLSGFAPITSSYMSKNANSDTFYNAGLKAIEWDEKNPSINSPMWICCHGMSAFNGEVKTIPEEKWVDLHKEIIDSLKKFLDKEHKH